MSADTPSIETGEQVQHAPPRGLLRLVYIMGIILVLLFLGLIGGIIWKAQSRKPAATPDLVMRDLGIDPASVKLMDLDGALLALTTNTEIIVLDVAKRKVVVRLTK